MQAETASRRARNTEPRWVRWTLIALAIFVLTILVIVPVVNVFAQALADGPGVYWKNLFANADTRHAVLLTLIVAPCAVVLNLIFGVTAAWAIARFRFPGRTILITLIDLPFSVSPVVAGLVFVLLFGLQGYFGAWLIDHGIHILFATPGLILVTTFVTFPYVARELIPVLEAIGSEEEVAALSLGAKPWQMYWYVTLPNIKWGLLYGVILCNARAMGEFGAVYVVSGRIAGQTDTLPLRVEKLFQQYNSPGSFAVASVLTLLALVTLIIKVSLEHKVRADVKGAGEFMSITVKNVTKRFGALLALDRVNLVIPNGSLCALLGPSGCGKTTLLRILAGLEIPDEGEVHSHEEDVTDRQARERDMGFVFQHYALFRHMNISDNIGFALRVRGWSKRRRQERVDELLHLIRLDGLGNRYPSELSGGQRQRVALARALAAQPKVLLLDEPFGALDAKVRVELRQWLRRFHEDIGVTSILVTHDQEEAFEVADQVVVMQQGRIEQVGTPQEIFDHPASAFVMDFLGNVNVFHGRVEQGRAWLGNLPVDHAQPIKEAAGNVQIYVRPHELDIDRLASNGLSARVVHVNPAGSVVRVQLISTEFGMPIVVELSQAEELKLQVGETVFVAPRKVRFFDLDYTI